VVIQLTQPTTRRSVGAWKIIPVRHWSSKTASQPRKPAASISIRGHRALSPCATHSADLPDGRVRDLHFCVACNSPAWVTRDPTKAEEQLRWTDGQF